MTQRNDELLNALKKIKDESLSMEAIKAPARALGSILFMANEAIAAIPEGEGWQTMDTAPRDGTHVLLWWPQWYHAPFMAYWSDRGEKWVGWQSDKIIHNRVDVGPSRWRPLPAPPVIGGG